MKHAAFTLIELLITLALIGVVVAVVTLLVPGGRPTGSADRAQLLGARRQAVRAARIVTGFSDSVGRYAAYPDGSIFTDSAPGTRLTGVIDAP